MTQHFLANANGIMNLSSAVVQPTLPAHMDCSSTTGTRGILIFAGLLTGFLTALNFLGLAQLPWLWVLAPLWMIALSVPTLLGIIVLRVSYLKWCASHSRPGVPRGGAPRESACEG